MDNQTVDGSEGQFEDRHTERRWPENQTGHCHVPVQVQVEAGLPVKHSDNHHNVSWAATKRNQCLCIIVRREVKIHSEESGEDDGQTLYCCISVSL